MTDTVEINITETNSVGLLVDSICENNRRDVRKVVGRLIEEIVELAAECGATPEDMRAHMEDSIHNMCLKQAYADGHTVFPSQLKTVYSAAGIAAEAGDVLLLLKDVLWCAGFSQATAEKCATLKFNTLKSSPTDLLTYDGSTFYRIKAHIK